MSTVTLQRPDHPQQEIQDLIDERAAKGFRRYGPDAHLQRTDLLELVAVELVDTAAYVHMDAKRRVHLRLDPSARAGLADVVVRCHNLATRVLDTRRHPDHHRLRTVQLVAQQEQVGQQYGEQWPTRENIAEAMEEIADAVVFLTLEIDRVKRTDPNRELLSDLALLKRDIRTLAFDVAALPRVAA